MLMTGIGAFADGFSNPVAVGLVLLLGCLLPRAIQLRSAALMTGAVLGLASALEGHGSAEAALLVLGGMVASLLHAEIVLHFVLPGWRLFCRVMATVWELLGDVAKFLLHSPPSNDASPRAKPPASGTPDRTKEYLSLPFDPLG